MVVTNVWLTTNSQRGCESKFFIRQPVTAAPIRSLWVTDGASRVGGECVTTAATGALRATGAASGMYEMMAAGQRRVRVAASRDGCI